MSVKSKSRTLGRMLRRLTGLNLTLAMRVAKKVVQGESEYRIVEKFPDVVKSTWYHCCDFCGRISRYQIVGPKGTYTQDYLLSEGGIIQEYKITMGLRNNPGRAVDNEGRVTG